MRVEEVHGLTVRITGGEDRKGGGEGPLVVLMHGFGAPGEDLVPLWRMMDVPTRVRFAFPAAPIELGGEFGGHDARAWWRIDMQALLEAQMSGRFREMGDDVPDELPAARASVLAAIDALTTELRVPEGQLVLGGFSQGAMLALDVALHTERALGGLALMSGTLIARGEWAPRMPARRGLKVVQSHGTIDPILPFAVAEKLRDLMRDAGLEVDWIPFRGQHQIPPMVLDRVAALLRSLGA